MDTASRRPWETHGTNSQPPNPTPQTLPSISTLVPNMDNPAPEKGQLNLSMSAVRESIQWPMPPNTQPPSTAYSNPMPYLNSSHQSPNRYSGPSQTSPFTSESSAGPSPGFSSNHQNHALPSMNSGNYDANQHRGEHRGSGDFENSRRSSVDSRVHQSMDRLALGPTSPYASANASQASIVSSHLQRERGIQPNGGSYRGPRFSGVGPISPLGSRTNAFVAGRVAPPILENPPREVYGAPVPSAGQAYAFPDPDAPDSAVSKPSRRGSYASSVTSSFMTIESKYPPGQHELPTHHHQLQHKQVSELQDDPDSPNSTTPYSRTPELRVTHKLAERKRRSEMKDCFELLRNKLPPNQNNKSSKWETLQRAIDHIQGLENKIAHYHRENEKQRQQMDSMDVQIKELSQQLQRAHSQGQYQTPPTALSPSPLGFGSNHYGNGVDSSIETPRTLPPLQINGAMQGVQYSDDRR